MTATKEPKLRVDSRQYLHEIEFDELVTLLDRLYGTKLDTDGRTLFRSALDARTKVIYHAARAASWKASQSGVNRKEKK